MLCMPMKLRLQINYFYSLVKYTNPPLIGTSTKDINDILNNPNANCTKIY